MKHREKRDNKTERNKNKEYKHEKGSSRNT